jgi:hypothetical protein
MKLSAGLAALSFSLAFVANVEASSAHDAAAGMCRPRAHHKGSGNIHKGPGNVNKGSGSVDKGSGNVDKGSGNVNKGSGTIKPANHGHCNPVGATCSFNSAFVGRREILTTVVCMQRKSRS